MTRYLVTTPNNEFSEKVMGIPFNRGRATVDEYSIDPTLGYTVEEVARRMHADFGYEVEEIGGEPINALKRDTISDMALIDQIPPEQKPKPRKGPPLRTD